MTALRRILRLLASPLKPFFVVLVPDHHVGTEVVAARYGWPLLTSIACACIAAFALASRVDVGPEVRAEDAKVEVDGAKKPEEIKTDREIDEAIDQRAALVRVKLGVSAVAGTPFGVLVFAIVLLLLARFVGGKPTMARMFTVAALAGIPGAVRSILIAVVAFRQDRILPSDFESLVQSPFGIVFAVWSAVIVVFGLAAGASMSKVKAFITTVVGLVVLVLVGIIMMGAPKQ